MRQYKAATALLLFAAFAYAQEEEVDSVEEELSEEDEVEEEVEETIVDIQAIWDEEKDMVEQYEGYSEDLYNEYYGYAEAAVAVVDGVVKDNELTEEELEDMIDFLEETEDADWEAVEDAAVDAITAVEDFGESVMNNADIQAALANLMTYWMDSGNDTGMGSQLETLTQDEAFLAAYQGFFASIVDADTQEMDLSLFDWDAFYTTMEDIVAIEAAQTAVTETVAEVDAMWTAIEAELGTMIDDVEAAWDDVLTAVDDILDDETHATVDKLMTIVAESLAGLEADEDFYASVETIDGYMTEVTGFVDNSDFTDMVAGVQSKLGETYDFAQSSIEAGLPEREYYWEEVEDDEDDEDDSETPDSAYSFAASAAAVVAAVAALSF